MFKQIVSLFTIFFISFISCSQEYFIHKDNLDSVIRMNIKNYNIPGVAVGIVVGNQLAYELSYGFADKNEKTPVSKKTGFQLASVSKPILAMLTLKLYEQGHIDLYAPINTYIPNINIPKSRIPITLNHLLSHSSGLPKEPVNRIDIEGSSVPKAYTEKELLEGLSRTELLYEPGLGYNYSTLGMHLVGYVLETITEKKLEDLMKSDLFEKLEMANTYAINKPNDLYEATHYWKTDNAESPRDRWEIGEIWGGGGLTSNVEEMAKFISLQFQIRNTGNNLIAPELIQLSHKPVVNLDSNLNGFVGLGWFIKKEDFGYKIYHTGGADGHSAYVSALPNEGIGLVVLANKGGVADEVGEELESTIYEYVDKLRGDLRKSYFENDWPSMEKTTEKLLGLNSNNLIARYFLGKSQFKLKKYEEAKINLTSAYENNTFKDFPLYYLASMSAKDGDNVKAERLLERAVNLGFTDGDELLEDENMHALKNTDAYKKLARWGHHH
ncbi:serine hydrolase [uncultured Croceitalea sp.]|uniref:serine hydrolase n=1 Tax=uncultured Croceitalea sp. TaxID=1798908 RepID=UPI003306628E